MKLFIHSCVLVDVGGKNMIHSLLKVGIISIIGLLVLSLVPTEVLAATDSGKEKNKNREELREGILERLKEKIGSAEGIIQNLTKRAAIINGTLSARNGTILTVTNEGKTYTVLTDGKTQLRRRFWGKATLDEMQIGDKLNVYGKWTDNTQAVIQARLIRDLSIQKRHGVFIGIVQSLTSNGWTMTTVNRGTQTVTVTGTTKFINRKQEPLTKNDIAVGHRVRVKGLWNRANNTITEVTQVKDYSLPPKPTTTPKLTPTITPTVTLVP